MKIFLIVIKLPSKGIIRSNRSVTKRFFESKNEQRKIAKIFRMNDQKMFLENKERFKKKT